MFAIEVTPFLFNPFMGGELPNRTFLAVPTVVWLFIFFPVTFSKSKITEVLALILGAFAFIQILYIQSVVQARAWSTLERDILLANSIYYRIQEVKSSDIRDGLIKIEVAGYLPVKSPYPIVFSSTAGSSFFEWDSGNKSRILNFMRLIGYTNLIAASKDECTGLVHEFSQMPSWPSRGSVRFSGDIALIKLSGDIPVTCR
jgi:hypothetical protein